MNDDNYDDQENGYVVAIYIRKDKANDIYRRKVNDLLSVLGALRGLQSAFNAIGTLIIGLIARKIFLSSIIRKVYHVRNYENIEYEQKRKADDTANDAKITGDSKVKSAAEVVKEQEE